jgi:hypothetical protein
MGGADNGRQKGGLKKWLSLLFCLLAAMLLFFSWLPVAVEQFFLPPFLEKSGLAGYQVSVYRLGFSGCILQVSGRPGSGAMLAVGGIQADWSPGGLLQGKLDRLLFSGLQIDYRAEKTSGRGAPGTLPGNTKQQPGTVVEEPVTTVLPFTVDLIQVRDSFITFHNTSGSSSLPFSLSAKRIIDESARKEGPPLAYRLQAKVAGHEMTADISYHHSTRAMSLDLAGNLDLQRLSREFAAQLPAPADINGRAEVMMRTAMRFAPFSMESLQAEAQLTFTARQDELRIKAEHVGIETQVVFDGKKSSSLLLYGEGLSMASSGWQFVVPRARFSGRGVFPFQNDNPEHVLSGMLKFADASLSMEKQEVRLKGMQLELPGTWPMGESSDAGVLKIGQILLQNTDVGHLQGSWDLSSEFIRFQGELQSQFVPEGSAVISSTVRVPGPETPLADFRIQMDDTPVSIEPFLTLVPELESVSGNGLLNMEGRVAVQSGRMEGRLRLDFHDGSMEIPGAGLKAEDIRFRVDFPDLPSPATAPDQEISIGTVSYNTLLVSDIKSRFRLESPGSLFVEKISGRWSEGRIFASSFRLQKGNQDFEAALFCDRLQLAEILSQLGLAQAEGSGRVSGRIPVRFSDGKVYVDDGFLYTAPGEKGILKVKKSEHLAAGIPADVPQFSPLHFASAALRDFEYNWAQLHVFSEGENLILKLQIDGKPGERLPFRFDQQNNVFVRLEEGSSGGIDQPVKLDINFNVPVNELFRYQQQLMPILRKIR